MAETSLVSRAAYLVKRPWQLFNMEIIPCSCSTTVECIIMQMAVLILLAAVAYATMTAASKMAPLR